MSAERRRARMRQQQKVQAQALKTKRAAMMERLAQQRRKLPRRRGRTGTGLAMVAGLVLLLLLLFLRPCTSTDPGPLDYITGPPMPPPAVRVARERPSPTPRAPKLSLPRIDRPDLQTEAPDPPAWIAGFRMQVSARSPRLAECFVGAERPGRLRWTATVEPDSGRVSQQLVEPQLVSEDLSARERDCVVGVLAVPPYQLVARDDAETPSRVSLVLEF